MNYRSIEDVARDLNLSIKAVRRYVASGELRAVKMKNVYKISEEDFEAFKNATLSTLQVCGTDLFGNPIYAEPSKSEKKAATKTTRSAVEWTEIARFWKKPTVSKGTFVDLFCGAGGLTKGLELAGFEGICGLDWFHEAGLTYARNFDHPFVDGDIKLPEVKERFYETVRNRLNGRKLTLVAGGFPCQGFSLSGNRIVDDPRNSLYLELIEIVKNLQPEFVLCENVKGLRSMLGGRVEAKILDDLKEIGYEANATVLCAADYRVPQKRERIIFIGNRIDTKNYWPKPLLTPENYITTGEAIADLMEREPDAAFNHLPTKHRPDMVERMAALKEGESLYKGYSDAWKKCPWDEASCTIKENHGGVNVHPKLPRVLAAREMARLRRSTTILFSRGRKISSLCKLASRFRRFSARRSGWRFAFR